MPEQAGPPVVWRGKCWLWCIDSGFACAKLRRFDTSYKKNTIRYSYKERSSTKAGEGDEARYAKMCAGVTSLRDFALA
jgi:hypothetical protein